PGSVRKTSFRHGLRTDAAARFEKGIDISATVNILQRAATLLLQVAGGAIASDVMDVFPHPAPKNKVELQYSYLKKLSGKTYPVAAVKAILESLGFVTLEVSASGMLLEVPYHKTDVGHSADIVEEILRIDGLDAIEIPGAITMTPAIDKSYHQEALKEKTASALVGLGFTEILTNSITNSRYFTEAQGAKSIKLLNNLSLELDVLRPAMLPTALEVIAFNNNRKNNNLQLFEFGKTYQSSGIGTYTETNHLCLYTTGQLSEGGWKKKGVNTDIYHLKGLAQSLLNVIGLQVTIEESESGSEYLEQALTAFLDGKVVAKLGRVATATAARFDVRQPVYFANFNWNVVIGEALRVSIKHQEVPRFPVVGRDLAVVVDSHIQFSTLENSITDLQLSKLANVKLFDIFESEKLGQEKKSLAINLIFSDSEKTLTDKEVDSWMGKIMGALERSGAEIRKQ
ncbi:MAG: phenylalanine--tRNA ligase beta subunit-related protein, partial [Chitinophagaceae bacterium]